MPRSGQEVLHALRSAHGDLQRTVRSLAEERSRQDQELRQAIQDLDQEIRGLAEHYLPELSRPAIAGTFAEVRDDLLTVLAQLQQSQHSAALGRDLLQGEQESLREQIDATTLQLNDKVRQREELEQQVADALAADSGFQKLSQQLQQAESRLAQNERTLAEVKQESQEKLPPYRQSQLFMYLHRRQFGTPAYASTGLVRRLDRWVAELIDYRQARQSYEFLTLTPGLMEDELARRREDFDRLMLEAQSQQQAVAEQTGLTAVLAAGEEIGAARDALLKKLDEVEQSLAQAEQRVEQLGQQHNEFYERGVDRLQKFIAQLKTELLERRVKETLDPRDDALAAKIVAHTRRVSQLQAHLREQASELRAAETQAGTLGQLVNRFQQSNFDAARSEFADSLQPEQLLAEFAKGQVDRQRLWRRLKSAQSFRPVRHTSFDHSGSMSPDTAMVVGAVFQVLGGALDIAARANSGGSSFGGGGRSRSRSSFPSSSSSHRSSSSSRGSSSFSGRSSSSGNRGGFTTGNGF